MKKIYMTVALLSCLFMSGCSSTNGPITTPPISVVPKDTSSIGSNVETGSSLPKTPTNTDNFTLASKNCIDAGGKRLVKKTPSGNSYGVCSFEDNRQCEELALLSGSCKKGGLKVTGYENDAQIYCAITGGAVEMSKVPISCELPNSRGNCTVDEYFAKGNNCVTK